MRMWDTLNAFYALKRSKYNLTASIDIETFIEKKRSLDSYYTHI